MRKRVATMIAVAALLIVGAAPALAAPGGVPGPPDHVKGLNNVAADDVDPAMHGPPAWAKAYGKRIKDATGLPYGHLVQCNKEVGAYEDWDCPTDLIFPEKPGAKVFALENGLFAF